MILRTGHMFNVTMLTLQTEQGEREADTMCSHNYMNFDYWTLSNDLQCSISVTCYWCFILIIYVIGVLFMSFTSTILICITLQCITFNVLKTIPERRYILLLNCPGKCHFKISSLWNNLMAKMDSRHILKERYSFKAYMFWSQFYVDFNKKKGHLTS